MASDRRIGRHGGALALSLIGVALVLCGCAAPPAQGINDPFEPANRAVHGVNKALDSVLVGPGSKAVGGVVPKPLRQGISNLGDTLDLPGDVANHLLQGDVESAAITTSRLAVNLVFGLGGLLDAATGVKIAERKTDFGETLHVWGFGEGAYVELPGLGPSTVRDTVGTVVDFALDPVGQALNGDAELAATAVKVFSRLNDRNRYSDTVDSILYDSADSYAQARLLYLQNRRFELGQSSATAEAGIDDGFIDPYEDPYGETTSP